MTIIEELGKKAKQASYDLLGLSTIEKNQMLTQLAKDLIKKK